MNSIEELKTEHEAFHCMLERLQKANPAAA
jgi:hypothetical protein